MQWPVPPKAADPLIVAAISADNPRDVLRVLATETASIITLARMLHDANKTARRALRKDINLPAGSAAVDVPFNDDLDLLNN